MKIETEQNGTAYTWTGDRWYVTKTYFTPPVAVVRELDKRLPVLLATCERTLPSEEIRYDRNAVARILPRQPIIFTQSVRNGRRKLITTILRTTEIFRRNRGKRKMRYLDRNC